MFFNCLKSEIRKFFCDRYLLAATVGLIIIMPFLSSTLGSYFGESGSDLWVSKLIQGSYLGQVGSVVISAMFFGNEFKRSTLRTCFLCTPKRGLFLITKTVSLLLILSGVWIISEAASIACLLMSGPLSVLPQMIAALIPAYVSMVELVLATVALTVITTSQLISMSVFVSLILGLNGLLLQFGRCMRYIPVTLSMNTFLIYPQATYLPLSQGLLYQGLWSLVLTIAAFIVFTRRPVR